MSDTPSTLGANPESSQDRTGHPGTSNGSLQIDAHLLLEAIEAANSCIVITDPTQQDNPLVYVNQGFLDLTGYTRDELIGRNCRLLQQRPDGTYDQNQDHLDSHGADIAGLKDGSGRTGKLCREGRRKGTESAGEVLPPEFNHSPSSAAVLCNVASRYKSPR
ncbi:MAG: PAS domain-containing protein [Bacteroidetes bacterium]|jgi:PAS domain S-box-containing protein|nr:PAS domain-containing protein [Bacteroidota bacterium]